MSAPDTRSSEPPKRSVYWGQWLSFALLVAIAAFFGFGIGSKTGVRPLAQITSTLSGAVHKTWVQIPRSLAPVRQHDWPE